MKRKANPIARAAPLVAAVILGAVATVGGISADAIPGVEEYHTRVREAVEGIPLRIGDWLGRTVEPQAEAVKLLKPNIVLQRQYMNPNTGRAVSLLVVHCGDTNDMLGHYPPVCYKANGWVQESNRIHAVTIGGKPAPAMDYRFSRIAQGAKKEMAVLDFFVLPDGRIVSDMDTLNAAAGKRAARQLGAAQIQILTHEDISDEERDAIFDEFLRAIDPAINAVAKGVQQ